MSLTISAATLDASGLIVDLTWSGVSGSLSPASAIKGLTPKVGGVSRIAFGRGVTTGANTTRHTLYTPVKSTETLTVDTAASPTSNLTDGGGNTISAQTGVNVTNGSSVTSVTAHSIPAGSLATWYAARAAHASARGEVVAFGDSTFFGSDDYGETNPYPPIYRIRKRSQDAGYTDGGRGHLTQLDNISGAGPAESTQTCVVSISGFAAIDAVAITTITNIGSDTVGDTITLRADNCQTARIFVNNFHWYGVGSYAIDGGADVELPQGSGTPIAATVYEVALGSRGSHTITFKNLRAGAFSMPNILTDGTDFSPTVGWVAGTQKFYKVTFYDGSANETLPSPTTGVTGTSEHGCKIHLLVAIQGSRLPTGGGMRIYRADTVGGTYKLLKEMSLAVYGDNDFYPFDDDNTITPTTDAPTVATLTADPGKAKFTCGVDMIASTGLVYHRNADSGTTMESYGFSGAFYIVAGQAALGLVQDGTTSFTAATRPPARNPVLSINALGVNNQQSGQTDVTPVTDGLTRWLAECDAAGCDALRFICHYSRSASPHTGLDFVDAEKAWCVANDVPYVDSNEVLDLAGNTTGGPHLNQVAYNVEGDYLWDQVLGVATGPTLSSPTATSVTSTTAVIGVTANTAEGTIYAVLLPDSIVSNDETSIRLGINPDTDVPVPKASAAGAAGVVSLGTITGLANNTGYTLWMVQQLGDGSYTDIVSLEGIETLSNVAPSTPTITAGTPGSTSVFLTGSAFSDVDIGDAHASSQWQVTETADTLYASTVISTGDDADHKTGYTAFGLAPETVYRARVRYKDDQGHYSSYSTSVTFTTAAASTSTNTQRRIGVSLGLGL